MNLAFSLYLFGLFSIAMLLYPTFKYKNNSDIYNFLDLFIYVLFILLGVVAAFIAIIQGIYSIPLAVLVYKGCILSIHHTLKTYFKD